MITETLTYVDFGGTERTEDFYFNLTEAEVLNLSHFLRQEERGRPSL